MALKYNPGSAAKYQAPGSDILKRNPGLTLNPNQGDQALSSGFGQYSGSYLPDTTNPYFDKPRTSAGRSLTVSSPSRPQGGGSNPGTVSTWRPYQNAQAPQLGDVPEYILPQYDNARVNSLASKAMAGPLGRLRRGLDSALVEARYSDNPNVRANATREALAGYGEGLSDIRSGATREAQSLYAPEYQAQINRTGSMFQAENQKMFAQFRSDMEDYIQRGQRITAPAGSSALTGEATYDPFAVQKAAGRSQIAKRVRGEI